MRRSRPEAGALPERRRSRFRARLAAVIGRLLVAPLSLCAAARAARLEESSSLLLLATGLTPLLGPPALVALGSGCGNGGGRWRRVRRHGRGASGLRAVRPGRARQRPGAGWQTGGVAAVQCQRPSRQP
jgi:hypothetical protein